MTKSLPLHSTLRALIAEHGAQEVLRVMGVISHVELKNKAAADLIGQARQTLHLAASAEA